MADYGSFLNENGELGDESLNKVINFINKFALFIETGNWLIYKLRKIEFRNALQFFCLKDLTRSAWSNK